MVKDDSSIIWYRHIKGNDEILQQAKSNRQKMVSSGEARTITVPNDEHGSKTSRWTTKHRYLFKSNIMRVQNGNFQ